MRCPACRQDTGKRFRLLRPYFCPHCKALIELNVFGALLLFSVLLFATCVGLSFEFVQTWVEAILPSYWQSPRQIQSVLFSLVSILFLIVPPALLLGLMFRFGYWSQRMTLSQVFTSRTSRYELPVVRTAVR